MARMAAVLVSLLLTAAVIAGCSAGGGLGAGGEGSDADAGTGVDEPAEQGDRAVVVTGEMAVHVDDVPMATAEAAQIVRSTGGRIDGRDEWIDDDTARASLVLRIPTDSLDVTLEDLRGLGEASAVSTASVDVTTASEDVGARIAALQSTIARLQSFQSAATDVDELLTIEQEVSERQAELEGYLAEQARYAEQTALATITLTLSAKPVEASAAPGTFWAGVVVGWNALVGFAGWGAVVLGLLLPWLVAAGLVAIVIVAIVRATRRRRSRPTPAATVVPDAPAHVVPAEPVGSRGSQPPPQ